MQCQYCGANNPGTVRICVSCKKPIPGANTRNSRGSVGYIRVPHAPYSPFGSRTGVRTIRRAAYLTGSTSTKPTSPTGVTATGPRTTTERTEPNWENAPFPSTIGNAHEKLQSAGLSPESPVPPPGRHLMRILFMLGIFAIGATVGLAGAWWLNRSEQQPAISGIDGPGILSSPSAQRNGQGRRPGTVRGISPDELPYDGAAHPLAEDKQRAVEQPLTSSAPAPEAALAKTENVVDGESSIKTPQSQPESTQGSDAPPSEPIPNAAGKAGNSDIKTPPVAQKRRPQTKSAKDREIERIKRQADEELKKKTEFGGDVSRPSLKGNRAAQRRNSANDGAWRQISSSAMRVMLARCEDAPNLFRREQCKWRLCGDRWGKNGCPSYASPQVNY